MINYPDHDTKKIKVLLFRTVNLTTYFKAIKIFANKIISTDWVPQSLSSSEWCAFYKSLLIVSR